MLIDKKADVNIQNLDGDCPLHKAAYIGRIDLVTLLLANKADIFIKNENLKLAKHLTQNAGVLALLEEVEESDLKKREIEFLNYAKNGDLSKMKELLDNEMPVDINCQDDQTGNTALHNAAFRNNKQVITFLLQQNNIDTTIKNKRQQIPAALSQNISIKQLLLDVKPNFNKPKGRINVNKFEGKSVFF